MTIRDKGTPPASQSNYFRLANRDATSGAHVRYPYIAQDVVRILGPVFKALEGTKNSDVAQGVKEVISNLAELFRQLSLAELNLTNLPSMHGANLEDGSFQIEWISPNYRIGFVIDADPKKSIWYLLTKQDASDSNLSGNLAGSEGKAAISQLVAYVVLHS